MNNPLQPHIKSIVCLMLLITSIGLSAQIFPNCPDTVFVETDLESCEAVIPNFSNLAVLPDGYSYTQDPSAGTVLSSMADWTIEVTLSASNGGDTQECNFLAILEPTAPDLPVNAWIAYCYNGKIIHGQDVFRGYYHEPNLDVSSWQLWDIGVSPSWHPEYIGCSVSLDQHSVVYRRTGFPCGNYQLDILNHDNEVRLYVNESEVFAHDGFNLQHYNVHSGFLDDNSLVEFEWNEGIGGSLGILDLILLCPTDTMLYLDANCEASMPDLRWNACSGGSVTQSIDPGTLLAPGDHNFTMTTTDITGWSESCTQVMHVIDTIPPFIDAPEDLEVGFNSQCSYFLPDFVETYSITDNCAIETITQSPPPNSVITAETMVTISAMDIHGNSISHSMTVSPVDDEAPSISCEGDLLVDLGSSCSFILPDYLSTVTTSDNCSSPAITQSPDPGTTITETGYYPITFTATDEAGLFSTCSFNLEVTDLTPPDLNCTENTYHYIDGNCEYLVPDLSMSLTYQDNCPSSLVLSQEPPANTPMSSLEDLVILFNLEDGAGNIASCSTTLHLIDTIAPALEIENSIDRSVDENCQYLLEDFSGSLLVTELCDDPIIEQSPPPGETLLIEQSPIALNFIVTDNSGNTSEINSELVLHDNTNPLVTCPESVQVYADMDCNYFTPDLIVQITAEDPCSGIQSITQSPSFDEEFYQNPPDAIEILVYDFAGNSQTCLTQVLAFDTIAPELPSIEPVQLALNEDCMVEIPDFTSDLIVTDNCSSSVQLIQDPIAGDLVDAMSDLSCAITAIDDAGNESTTTVQILYNDDTLPSIECPESFSFDVDSVCFWTAIDLTDQVIVNDNCSATLTIEQDLPLGEEIPFSIAPYTVEFIVSDGAGNQNSCNSSILLQDVLPPVLLLSDDLLVANSPGECGAIVEFEQPTSTDNCGEATIAQILGPISGSFFEVGSTEISFSSTDDSGNISEGSFFVNVVDEEAPEIICPQDLELTTAETDCAIWLEFDEPEATDNCEVISLTQISGPVSESWVEPGNYTVVFLAADNHGNESECSFQVNIVDNISPEIFCPPNITQANDEGLCGAFVSFQVSATDNCSGFILEQIEGASSGSYFTVGTHQITYKATDGYGNVSQCSFEIEVIDEEPPYIQCSWDISATDPIVTYNMPISNDNCGIVDLELLSGLESGSTFASGENIVEFIATDPSSNFSTCQFEVYINTPPVAMPILLTTHLNYLSIDPLVNDHDLDGDPFFLDSIELPDNARLEYDNTVSYFPDKTTCIGDSIPYSIRDVHGAVSSSYIKIELLCPELLDVPEGFSPNNDGINDAFIIVGIEDFPGSQINVFNEQGVRVYFSSAYKNSWEGISNVGFLKGNALPEGKYYYVLEIKQNTLKQTGFIILKK